MCVQVLSVSSNGSNGLRQAWMQTAKDYRVPFSILERIEWAATLGWAEHIARQVVFQYPRTDRMGCDPCASTWQTSSSQLSVSSNGSNGLRPPLHRIPHGRRGTFSILERIEWAATGGGGRGSLSVSAFQYPRTDRMGCDRLPVFAVRRVLLSFQYPRTDRMGCDVSPRTRTTPPHSFQYPRTDRMGCDAHPWRTGGVLALVFQYPRTDRMGCDIENRLGSNHLNQAFSILERIEWAATK